MIIKTTSQLQPTTLPILSSSLFEVSVPVRNNLYSSRSATFNDITRQIVLDAENKISNDFNLKNDDGSMIDVNALRKKVRDLYEADQLTINGSKYFNARPMLLDKTLTEQLNKYNATDVEDVKTLIRNSPTYIGPISYLKTEPLENNIDSTGHYTKDIRSSNTANNEMLYFHIDDGMRDSLTSKDAFTTSQSRRVCPHTGHLVMYGWFAQQGEVEPQDAWIALCGKIRNGTKQQWTILQLQPWLLTENSKKMQYVSFNMNVKQGLELKIVTGFRVDAHSSEFTYSNTLGFRNYTPNTCVGYVIYDVNDR